MATTKKEIADALGLTVQRLDDIFGTGNRVEVNKKVNQIATEILSQAIEASENRVADLRQQSADIQSNINKIVSEHQVVFDEVKLIIEQSNNNFYTDQNMPDLNGTLDRIK